MTEQPNPRSAGVIDVKIGRNLRRLRNLRKISQTELGATIGGVTFQQVQKYESGKNRIALSRALRVCEILQCSVLDLVRGVTPEDVGRSGGDLVSTLPSDQSAGGVCQTEDRIEDFLSSRRGHATVAAFSRLPPALQENLSNLILSLDQLPEETPEDDQS